MACNFRSAWINNQRQAYKYLLSALNFIIRNTKIGIYLTLVLVLMSGMQQLQAQDPVYSQFYAAPTQLNPAFTGNAFGPRIVLNYRNQWPGHLQAYSTYGVSYDQYIHNIKSGVGLSILADDAGQGLIKTIRASGQYAYQLKLDRKSYMRGGLEGSFVQVNYDWESFRFPDQIDDRYGFSTPGGAPNLSSETPPDNSKLRYYDFSAGFLYYNPLYYLGLTLTHLIVPDESLLGINDNLDNGLPLRWSIHAGMEIQLPNNNILPRGSFLSPNILYVRQGDFQQLNIGSIVGFRAFFTGVWYRHAGSNPDALIFNLGWRKGVIKAGYSFDYTVSDLAIQSGGSHEISIQLLFEGKKPESRYLDCFQIFR